MKFALPAVAAIALVPTTPSFAAPLQTGGPPVVLVRAGDTIDTLGVVTSLGDRVAVDDSGGWLVGATSATGSAVLRNGAVARRVGGTVSAPAGVTITNLVSFGVNGAGNVVWTLRLSNGKTGFYWDDTLALLTGNAPLNSNNEWGTGLTYATFLHGQPNDNRQFLALGAVGSFPFPSNNYVSVVSVTTTGTPTHESVRIANGWTSGTAVTSSVPVRPEAAALDDSGRSGFNYATLVINTETFGLTSTCCGTSIALGLGKGLPAGAAGHIVTQLVGAAVDLNSANGWVSKARAELTPGGASGVHIFASTGGAVVQRHVEGDALPSIAPWTIQAIPYDTPVFLTDDGKVLWYADWNDPDTSRDEGIFLDGQLLVQEGVTRVAGVVIEALNPAGLSLSPNGRYAVFRGRLAGGVEALFRIQPGVPVALFCSGDGSATACPCGNGGLPGHGCASSLTAFGAQLTATGWPSVSSDSLRLVGALTSNTNVTYIQGSLKQNGGLGNVFGDGLRCAGGSVIRLGTLAAVNGASSYPGAGQQPVSVRGMVPAAGGSFTYQIWYRNAAAFCTPSTFNLTNGLEVAWSP